MDSVLIDKPRPHVTLITLDRPERMNAMAFDVMIPFRKALEEVSRDNDTRSMSYLLLSPPPKGHAAVWGASCLCGATPGRSTWGHSER